MPSVHLLNVSPGDCTIIRHGSKRVTMVDICDGYTEEIAEDTRQAIAKALARVSPGGNFGMCRYPTNPITYARDLGITSIFRFILTHPDMDHMDGFDALCDQIGIGNFWDTGARRDKPDFSGNGSYREEDWDRYVKIRDGKEKVGTRIRRAGDRFVYANKVAEGQSHSDGLYILAPDANLINDPDTTDDINEGSYVLLYRSGGGRVLLAGDAHDASWEYVCAHYARDIKNCSFLLAPHHGRDSGRSYDFLDAIKPKLTLIGCAPSEYIDYDQWNRRKLPFLTSNQAGNVVLETQPGLVDVYIQNETYAEAAGCDLNIRNNQNYVFWDRIVETAEASS